VSVARTFATKIQSRVLEIFRKVLASENLEGETKHLIASIVSLLSSRP